MMTKKNYKRKPSWLKVKITSPKNLAHVHRVIEENGLNTVCKSANCPNLLECYGNNTATFMILGNSCTRKCTFCNIDFAPTKAPDLKEPKKVAEAVKALNLSHAVITSVTRDDLIDGGASHFYETIIAIRALNPLTTIEVLIPDFQGNTDSLKKVISAKPDIINHNIETISKLYTHIRPEANYQRSLQLLNQIKLLSTNTLSKSGFMVGLGESKIEVIKLINDLSKVNLDFLTIGQYIPPSKNHAEVKEYINPEIFEEYKAIALDKGIKGVASGPLVRSSYNAQNLFTSSQK